ncbi:MAG: MATE family efflux transporter [Cellulosilyticaceae bacterium]
MNQRDELLRTESPIKLLIKFSIPAILGMLVNSLYNIVDRIYIGNIPEVGDLAITGVGITFPIMNMILGIAMLIAVGAGAKISIDLGAGKKDHAEKTIANALVLQVIAAILIVVVGIAFLDPLLEIFGATANTFSFAKNYITIILFGAIFNISSFLMTSTIRAEGNPKLASIIIAVCAGTNVILDPIFIFGLGMGVQGAAIATVISQAVGVLLAVLYYKGPKSILKVRRHYLGLDKEIVLPMMAIGMAPFFMQVAASAVSIVANRSLLAYGGDTAIGAMAIINSIVMMILMPIFGINQGAQPIIGYNYGAKLYGRVKQAITYALILGTVFSTIGWLIILAFAEYLVMAFNKEPGLLQMTTEGMRIWGAAIFCIGFQIVASNYYQAIGKAKVAIVLSLMRQVILLIPAIMILSSVWGLNGIWVAGPISDFLSTVITAVVFLFEVKHLNQLIKENR